jgi:hypothetical protein
VSEYWKRLDALKQEVQSWPRPGGVHLRQAFQHVITNAPGYNRGIIAKKDR